MILAAAMAMANTSHLVLVPTTNLVGTKAWLSCEATATATAIAAVTVVRKLVVAAIPTTATIAVMVMSIAMWMAKLFLLFLILQSLAMLSRSSARRCLCSLKEIPC